MDLGYLNSLLELLDEDRMITPSVICEFGCTKPPDCFLMIGGETVLAQHGWACREHCKEMWEQICKCGLQDRCTWIQLPVNHPSISLLGL
jgi:hypothetical protein